MDKETKFKAEETEINPPAYTPEQLQSIFSQWRHGFEQSKAYRGSDGKIKKEEFEKLYDSGMRELITRLTGEKDRLGHVFETEKGSVYFVLQSGESLRVKCSTGKFDEFSIHPILKDIFFISQSEQERILKICRESGRSHNGVLGVPIEIANFGTGACPVELNMYNNDRLYDTAISKSGDTIKLIAPKFEWTPSSEFYEEDAQGQISNGIHIGDRITKVIK